MEMIRSVNPSHSGMSAMKCIPIDPVATNPFPVSTQLLELVSLEAPTPHIPRFTSQSSQSDSTISTDVEVVQLLGALPHALLQHLLVLTLQLVYVYAPEMQLLLLLLHPLLRHLELLQQLRECTLQHAVLPRQLLRLHAPRIRVLLNRPHINLRRWGASH